MSTGHSSETSAIDSLGKGTVVMVFGTMALLLLNFIGRVYTARHLPVAEFGDFNLGLALAGLLSLVALVGLHQAMARTIAESMSDADARRIMGDIADKYEAMARRIERMAAEGAKPWNGAELPS